MDKVLCYNNSVEGRGHFYLPTNSRYLRSVRAPRQGNRQNVDGGFLCETMEITKVCNKCGKTKLLNEFGKGGRHKFGRLNICKDCKAAYDRWRKHNKDIVHKHYKRGFSDVEWSMYTKYDLRPAEYLTMLESQGGTCAICGGVPEDGKRLCVDHDHKTGDVRGLLCNGCNFALGAIKDDTKTLSRMISYLMGARLKRILRRED